MSAGTLENNLLNSLTGQVEKAYIDIIDKRLDDVVVEELQATTRGDFFGMPTVENGVYNVTSKNVKLDMQNAMMTDDDLKSIVNPLKQSLTRVRRYIVQFNPSTLNIQAMGGGRFAVTNHAQGKGNSKLDYTALTPRIQLSVKLIFDEVQRPSLQSKDDSVKTQVEAFIAALRNPRTRSITFAWGKLCYSGNLISVDSRYTMFSMYGKPLRAEVTLTMVCMDENLKKDNMGMWKERYVNAFQADSSDLTSFGQKLGNLVKINL